MKKLFPSFLLLAFVYLTAFEASAQHFNRRKLYNTVSVNLNAMNYFGDVVPKTSFVSLRVGATRPNLGFSYMHRFAPRISGRVGLNFGQLTGDDQLAADVNDNDASYRYYRNLRFRSNIVEASSVIIIDLFENRGTYLKRREFAPYVFFGAAVFHHNPKAEDASGKFVALQPLGTEGQFSTNQAAKKYPKPYSRTQISIPFGAGIRYKLDRQYDIGFEIGWRKTFTDYLDDVSGKYANPVDLSPKAREMADRSGELTSKLTNPKDKLKYSGYGVPNSKRGTDNEDDWYIVTGFNFSYILTPKLKSPKFR
jgi:Domain of unknown function (DUF6089)